MNLRFAFTQQPAIFHRKSVTEFGRRFAAQLLVWPTNIVEGCARDSDREHARFFEIALGSAREVIYLVGLSSRLDFVDRGIADEITVLGNRVAAALSALKKSIK